MENDTARAALQDIVAPLRAQFDEVVRTIAETEQTLNELRTLRKDIETVLRRLDPTMPKPRPRGVVGDQRRYQRERAERIAALRAYLDTHAVELADGFTPTDLVRRLANDKALHSTNKTVQSMLEQLHDEGVVRLDRKVRGGGRLYKIVGNDG